MTASVCRRSTCWTCLSCWKCVERTCCRVWSSAGNTDGRSWLALLFGSTEPDRRASPAAPRSLAVPPAHWSPTQPVARTTFGIGDDLKSGCGAQEVVQLIFIFYTEIIRLKIPWSIFLKTLLLLLWCLQSSESIIIGE